MEKEAAKYDPVRYKLGSMANWNLVAPGYHNDWAGKGRGPFRSTAELVRAADVRAGHAVLDVACGTGAVSMEIARYLKSSGLLIGIDFSRGALKIAKSFVPSGQFVEMDAENIGLKEKFDRVLCQYALMFFPEPVRVLAALKALMKDGGRLAVAVHGAPGAVPYFSTVMEPVLRHIPGIRPEGTPTVHRFGDPDDLRGAIAAAGFVDVSVEKFAFEYRAGTFEEYWSDYLSTTAASIRSKIDSDPQVLQTIKEEAQERAARFTKNGAIDFPWEVLVATAKAQQD